MSSTRFTSGAALAVVLAACGGAASSDRGGNVARVTEGAIAEVSPAGAGARTVTLSGATVDASAATVRIDGSPAVTRCWRPE